MKLIVGLGNPGKEYENTRHNTGFKCLDLVSSKLGVSVNRKAFSALIGKTTYKGEQIILMKPQTYMNLSGDAVQPAAAFYKVPPERVLVVSDDVSLPLGKLRIRASGSAGGHNGLKSIISRLGTEAFPRVKVGVGAPPNQDYDLADWVLSGFHGQDAKVIAEATERAADALESILSEGVDRAMSKFNG
jgi:PTH1 family peptidyl-tRNA hydrolase